MTKDGELIRVFFAKMKNAYLNLPENEKLEFMQRDRANLDELGMKPVSMIDCSGVDGEWDYIGIEGWPGEEAIEKRERFEGEILKLSKYVEYKSIVGREMRFEGYGK